MILRGKEKFTDKKHLAVAEKILKSLKSFSIKDSICKSVTGGKIVLPEWLQNGFDVVITNAERTADEQANFLLQAMGVYKAETSHKDVSNRKSLTGYNINTVRQIFERYSGKKSKVELDKIMNLVDKSKGKNRDYKSSNLTSEERQILSRAYTDMGKTIINSTLIKTNFRNWIAGKHDQFNHVYVPESRLFAFDFDPISKKNKQCFNLKSQPKGMDKKEWISIVQFVQTKVGEQLIKNNRAIVKKTIAEISHIHVELKEQNKF